MSEKRTGLTKALGRTDILALGFGTMVGWIWIVLTTTWVTEAGFWGTIIAFGVGVFLILLIGVAYGEMTSALPLSGGEMVYAYRAGGTKFGWAVGWIMVLAYLGVAVWEGIALATAMNYLLPIPNFVYLWDIAGEPVYLSWALIGAAGGFIMLLLNLFGTKPAIIFQVMATMAIISIAIMMLLGSMSFGDIENIGKAFTDLSGIFYVMMLVPSMLIGFDVIPQSAEEMNISNRDIGKMMIVCIVVSSIWYVLVIIAVGVGAPEEIRGSGTLPVADVFAYIFGNDTFAAILVAVGLLGIMTSWNGFFMGATRLIFAMGRAKMIPMIFGKTGKRFKTPWAATLVVGVLCIAAPFLGGAVLSWMVNLSSLCALFAYCCVTVSLVILRVKEPELARPFKAGKTLAFPVFVLVLSIVYFIIYIVYAAKGGGYLPVLIFVMIWLVFGLAMNRIASLKFGKISYEEREHLIFGDKLSRFVESKVKKQ